MFFTGQGIPSKRVTLRGSSRGEETREQVLERTRLDRERRQRAKLETRSAVLIQALWRSWRVRSALLQGLRDCWAAQYDMLLTAKSRDALKEVLLTERSCLSILLQFADVRREDDAARLASVLAALFTAEDGTGSPRPWLAAISPTALYIRNAATGTAPRTAHEPQRQQQQPLANTDQEQGVLHDWHVHRLAVRSLKALAALRWEYRATLLAPRHAPSARGTPAALLVEGLVAALTPTTWPERNQRPDGSAGSSSTHTAAPSTSVAAGIGRALVAAGLFPALRQLLEPAGDAATEQAATTAGQGMSGSTGAQAGSNDVIAGSPVTYGELLTTQAAVRVMALKPFSVPDVLHCGVHHLLYSPGLWRTCPSLATAARALCRRALADLFARALGPDVDGQQLDATNGELKVRGMSCSTPAWLTALPTMDEGPDARVKACAALLSNLLQVGPMVASEERDSAAALHLVHTLSWLLSLLPADTLLQGSTYAVGTNSGSRGLAGVAGTAATAAGGTEAPGAPAFLPSALPDSFSIFTKGAAGWSARRLPMPLAEGVQAQLYGAVAQLSELRTRELLRSLIGSLLPITSAPAPVAAGGGAAAGTAVGSAGMAQVQALCLLLWQLLSLPAHGQRLVLHLAATAELVPRLWFSYLRPRATGAIAWNSGASPLHPASEDPLTSHAALTAGCAMKATLQDPGWLLCLRVLAPVFSAHLSMSPLEDFDKHNRPLPPNEVCDPKAQAGRATGLLALLNNALWQVLWVEAGRWPRAPPATALRSQFAEVGGHLLCLLYMRNFMRPFCANESFVAHVRDEVPAATRSAQGNGTATASASLLLSLGEHFLPSERFFAEATAARPSRGAAMDTGTVHASESATTSRVWQVLQHAPCLVPFQERVRLFHHEISTEREVYRNEEVMRSVLAAPEERFQTIRRDHLLFDGFERLNRLGEALKGRVRIQFVDAHGIPEAGVDGGGLFKDFMEELLRQGMNPHYGLFAATPQQQLYPSPAAYRVLPEGSALQEFMGRMLGKALWEGVLLEVPLAPFFLRKFRGERCDLNDLSSLDPEIYRNLMALRSYSGDVSDLALTFAVDTVVFGNVCEVELKPGGAAIPVTNDNVMEYIYRVADYRLNVELTIPTSAFLHGFYDLIRPEWVHMFNSHELQMLISGSEDRIDMDDLASNCAFGGGYHTDHPVILALWDVLRGFSSDEQHAFLKFATSCSRAPLLGFKYLEPPLCIQMAGSMLDEHGIDRLPTASTCMNLLKLPPYGSARVLREKLLYAITSASGFDLS